MENPAERESVWILPSGTPNPPTMSDIARGRGQKLMGKHVNTIFDTVIGTVFLALITAAALAAIPLMVVTNSGQP
jgi:hypothetical protein